LHEFTYAEHLPAEVTEDNVESNSLPTGSVVETKPKASLP
jgi:hypothetical protein